MSRLKSICAVLVASWLLLSCTVFGGGRETVVKPRIHHTWYKNHVHHRKLHIGRMRIPLFEKQGVKKVRVLD